MADIFLSYTEKDRETVGAIAAALQSCGWSVWWDRRIPAGSTWRELLEREMQAMRCMVVVWSSNSIASDWVREEAAEGRLLGRLIPVAIEAVRPPAGFREIQAADLVGWDGSPTAFGMQRLIEDIERKIGRPDVAAPPVAEATVAAVDPAPEAPRPAPAPARSRRPAWLGAATLAIVVAAVAVVTLRTPERHDAIPATSANDGATSDTARRPDPIANVFSGADDPVTTPAPSDKPAGGVPRIFGPGTTPVTSSTKTAGVPATKLARTRCGDLQLKAATGEPLSSADRTAIERECTK